MFNHARAERNAIRVLLVSLGISAYGALSYCTAKAQEVGEPTCAPYVVFAAQLSQKYGEARAFQGVLPNGLLLEVWLNAETGTCTAMTIEPRGIACVQATCEGGRLIDPPKGSPS